MIEPGAVSTRAQPTYRYLIQAAGKRIVWAPEFMVFPRWAAGADLARDAGVRRLVFVIGRPTIRAFDGTM